MSLWCACCKKCKKQQTQKEKIQCALNSKYDLARQNSLSRGSEIKSMQVISPGMEADLNYNINIKNNSTELKPLGSVSFHPDSYLSGKKRMADSILNNKVV